ncbi:FadR/GntR family transcriptional regulator [Labrys wisconsinensis]|uniref:DNA-binding FadR family transcriptional regulator n=1 Tax=Labrys wisconsinensis TaxID=425677 RepID=A0ABU0J833_9HYPH|nr:FadR/GntR family transcriptional regulator [Labrys wisconsinensis]MDQ0469424.1 DNA-binding FadR family transcriptional regulator [Labrys wisconsinensis]
MALKLEKVSRGPHLPTLVASSISREIAQGRLKPGDQLPTEQVLATTFGVSRNVVREAIARLRSEGRVWSHQGRGAFVADKPDAGILTIDYDPQQAGEAFRSLFEMRGALEVEGAALAAERRTAADLAKMRAALDSMTAAPYGSVQWLKADLEFHLAVVGATRNVYMVQVLGFVAEKVRESILAAGGRQGSDDMARATVAEHEAILSAVSARDPAAARSAMAQHLRGAATRVGIGETKQRKRPATPGP